MGDPRDTGPRSQTGRGATWVGDAPNEPAPQSPPAVRGGEEFPILDDEALRRSEGPSTGEVVGQMWGRVLHFLITRIWRPVKKLRDKAAARFLDRTVDSDTFDRKRARDWKKFHDGRTSSSYLQDTDDK